MLLTLLSSVPSTVWSALVASVLTLSGVLVSNRSNNARLLRQLQHDSAEKAKERTNQLRRDVYIATVEELTKANSFLGTIAHVDLTQANASEALQRFYAAARNCCSWPSRTPRCSCSSSSASFPSWSSV